MTDEALVKVRELRVSAGTETILADVALELRAGQIATLVGNSGAGKTTIARVIAGIEHPGLSVSGVIERPARVGYLPQHAAGTLNPARKVGHVLGELIRLHSPAARRIDRAELRTRVRDLLEPLALGNGSDAGMLRRYPHEFSGGQRVRLALAQVLATGPSVVILDEPTAGLDPISARLLAEALSRLAARGVAVMAITHDLATLGPVSDRVLRAGGGRVLSTSERAVERPISPGRGIGDASPALLRADRVTVRHRRTVAVEDISFDAAPGELVALIGPSGSGKTTIAAAIAGLRTLSSGQLRCNDRPLPPLRRRSREMRAVVQYVPQEAVASFDPRRRVLDQVAATAVRLRGLATHEARREAEDVLGDIGLAKTAVTRYPAGLSGGQLQRAAIVRAVLARPALLVCDEVSTGLDPALATRVLDFLDRYRREAGAAVVLVSHDLRAVLDRADRVLVVDEGRIVDSDSPRELMSGPQSTTTRSLLMSLER